MPLHLFSKKMITHSWSINDLLTWKAGERAERGANAHFYSNKGRRFSIKMLHLEGTLSYGPPWASAANPLPPDGRAEQKVYSERRLFASPGRPRVSRVVHLVPGTSFCRNKSDSGLVQTEEKVLLPRVPRLLTLPHGQVPASCQLCLSSLPISP